MGLGTSNRLLTPLAVFADGGSNVRVKVHNERALGEVSPCFMGLGYEISSVAREGLLNATNSVYVQLLKTLGARGHCLVWTAIPI